MNSSITKAELLAKGYNVRQAARALGRSVEHVRLVLSGHRSSQVVMASLCSLPQREYKARRRVDHTENS